MAKILFNTRKDKKNLQRRDFITKTLSEYLIPEDSIILEVGIGNGRFGLLLAEYFKQYLGIDPDEEYVELAKKNVPSNADVIYKLGKAESIPFEKQVEAILFANVWHFIKDTSAAIKEIDRLLKKDGVVLIIEPSSNRNTWADERLNKNSEKFDKQMYERKISHLRVGKEVLLKQKELRQLKNEKNKQSRQLT